MWQVGAGRAEADAAAGSVGSGAWNCEQLPFAESTPVPEASGAAWMTIGGKQALVVVGDSGNDGAFGVIDPDTGATLDQGKLPLGNGASDDLEGVDARGDRLYGLTSAGWMRVWRRNGSGFELVDGPYPIGDVDPNLRGNGNKPPNGDGMVCSGERGNCGRNYEGLCLAPRGINPLPCVGFAAAKADGHLYCLTETDGHFRVHRDRAIAIAPPGMVADCAFDDHNALWVGSNIFDLGSIYNVDPWIDPAKTRVARIGPVGIGNSEVIAVRGDVIYRMSDTNGSPSLMAKFRCSPPAR